MLFRNSIVIMSLALIAAPCGLQAGNAQTRLNKKIEAITDHPLFLGAAIASITIPPAIRILNAYMYNRLIQENKQASQQEQARMQEYDRTYAHNCLTGVFYTVQREKVMKQLLQNNATIKIQAHVRGMLDRHQLKKEHNAATKIQSLYRGTLARKQLANLKELSEAFAQNEHANWKCVIQ